MHPELTSTIDPRNNADQNESHLNGWRVAEESIRSRNTINPIRKICDSFSVIPNPDKALIRLHVGDPTTTGGLPPSDEAIAAVQWALETRKYDGYGPSVGWPIPRQAIAQRYSTADEPLTADQVMLTTGASHALQLAIDAIANEGENILLPNPCFPLYHTLCQSSGIEGRGYRLNLEKDGSVDLEDLERQIDDKTRAILVNNPGNPTGSVFTKEHLEDILRIAAKHQVPIISDEIYGDLTYDGAVFHPMATLEPKVPLIVIDGTAKRWVIPGWRIGWAIVYNRFGVLTKVKEGMVNLSQKNTDPCALMQGALPQIINNTPQSFFDHIKEVVAVNARIVNETLGGIEGLRILKSQGAMYLMLHVAPEIYGAETEFTRELITEQSVFCLPGGAFGAAEWVRIVITHPAEVTKEATNRIKEYCEKKLRERK